MSDNAGASEILTTFQHDYTQYRAITANVTGANQTLPIVLLRDVLPKRQRSAGEHDRHHTELFDP